MGRGKKNIDPDSFSTEPVMATRPNIHCQYLADYAVVGEVVLVSEHHALS